MKLLLSHVPSPIGTISLVTDGEALCALEFQDCEPRLHRSLRLHYGSYELAQIPDAGEPRRQLEAYFEGDMAGLDRLPVHTGGTEFQRSVWAALRLIPAGTTTTYGQLAVQIGRAKAIRAVGHANGANPVSIVVPCHRVVGTDAKLTGYGGGIERKAWLIAHERRQVSAQ